MGPTPTEFTASREAGRGVRLFLVACLLTSGASSPGAITPPLERVPLSARIRLEALIVLADADHQGLGAEARRLEEWSAGHREPFALVTSPPRVEDASGAAVGISPAMATALRRLNQWYGLAAPESDPITHRQLQAAALTPSSVLRIRSLFEAAIERGLSIDSAWLTPETGGEATIDGDLWLAEAVDSRWSVARDLVRASDEPSALAALLESRAAEVPLLDAHGLLRRAAARYRLGTPGSGDELRRAARTVALNTAPSYSLGPEGQFALIVSRDWEGRYVGGWHTHGPHLRNGEWTGGDVPSFEDMRNAVEYGQYLTLSFQPDGFDLYDAEPLGKAGRIDLSLLRVIRYRSPDWRRHFDMRRPGLR